MDIAAFFADRSIFITGATGFIGKGVIEKLLRSCPNIKTIYALVRDKKGAKSQDRIQQTLISPIFDLLRKEDPLQFLKVIALPGDIESPLLGLSNSDLAILVNEVTVIFHVAATIKFNEHLKKAMIVNVGATDEIIKIAKMIPNISSMIHVSTAYSNCHRHEVEEKVYEMKENPHQLLQVVKLLNDDLIELITSELLGPRPNTYTFTKALAEEIVREESNSIPIAIVRPSIVMNTWSEPFPGFADNMTGANGIFAAGLKGILRAIYIESANKGSIIPLDKVVNTIIAAAWKRGIKQDGELRVYHCCSNLQDSLTWEMMFQIAKEYVSVFKITKSVVRTPYMTLCKSWVFYRMANFFHHYLPCVLMDVRSVLRGAEPKMLEMYNKTAKSIETIQYFMVREWNFKTDMMTELDQSLTPADKMKFNVDIKEINWRNYFLNAFGGIRKYVLNDNTFLELPIPQHLLKEPFAISESDFKTSDKHDEYLSE